MHRIDLALQVAYYPEGHGLPTSVVAVFINERSLMDLVMEQEVAAGRVPPGTPHTTRYRWMSASVAGNPLHWLGQPRDKEDESYLDESGPRYPYVLDCVSGFAGECGLYAVVVADPDRVRWSRLGSLSQASDSPYASLGPYEFERRQYESALESLPNP